MADMQDFASKSIVIFLLVLSIGLLPPPNLDAQQVESTNNAKSKLPKTVATLVNRLPADTTIGIVVIDRKGKVVFQHNAETELPAASSIKSILLLELFAKYSSELDVADRKDIAGIVSDKSHAAVAHFSEKNRSLIAKQLTGVTIKQLGKILIDSEDQSGKKYSNAVYNAASNVAIALLGGPKEASKLIHDRHPAFKDVNFRRYMLAARNVTGDNTATPIGLATLFRITVGKTPKGMESKTAREVAKILHARDYENGAKLYAKGGTLYSDPVTQVRSGQYQIGKTRMSYAIMAKQKQKSPATAKAQYDTLQKLTLEIYKGLKNPK